ncbi:MAG: response regulator [Lachnospiraceae bacterium]|nr:response regulator [Lachnospiraceae bacterium]
MADSSAYKDVSRILIVDDVEANRFVLRGIIEDMGYQPVLTENGMQALKMMQYIKPHLIILDIAMPEMDGYEVCKKIKEDAELRDIPIIFISAYDDAEDIVKGFEFGGADYVTKPFIPEVVKARVGMHLRLYESNRSMAESNRQLQISISEQMKQMEAVRKSVLYALIRVARENANYDEEYMERLCYNSRMLAEAMQLSSKYGSVISDNYIDMIELAAPLCDLGNLAVPTDILQKKGSLTEEESAAMQKHTVIGARIMKDVAELGNYNSFVNMSMEIANYHHENWDGSGYPEGKKADEIPISAQIVAVAGAYCALTSDRTYRAAFGMEDAMKIMEMDSGKKFNPDIFSIMKKIVKQLR